jgi:hypothetical protein
MLPLRCPLSRLSTLSKLRPRLLRSRLPLSARLSALRGVVKLCLLPPPPTPSLSSPPGVVDCDLVGLPGFGVRLPLSSSSSENYANHAQPM